MQDKSTGNGITTMGTWTASKSMGKCRHGRQAKVWENAGMEGKQKYGKMQENDVQENGKKLGSSVETIIKTQEMRAKAWENAG